MGLNGGLYLIFFALFIRPFREKRKDILQPSLLLISLQMLIFFLVAGVFWYGKLPFVNLFWALLVFIGILVIQVWEQTTFLKSVEKSHK
jgi:membrane protein implicated in regulation of membrane protease activity